MSNVAANAVNCGSLGHLLTYNAHKNRRFKQEETRTWSILLKSGQEVNSHWLINMPGPLRSKAPRSCRLED